MKNKTTDLIMNNQIFGWIALATGILLTIPLIAMQISIHVNWTLTDFIVMGGLIFGMASLFVIVARVTSCKYRILIGLSILMAFLVIWVHLAVGIVDSWPLAGS